MLGYQNVQAELINSEISLLCCFSQTAVCW